MSPVIPTRGLHMSALNSELTHEMLCFPFYFILVRLFFKKRSRVREEEAPHRGAGKKSLIQVRWEVSPGIFHTTSACVRWCYRHTWCWGVLCFCLLGMDSGFFQLFWGWFDLIDWLFKNIGGMVGNPSFYSPHPYFFIHLIVGWCIKCQKMRFSWLD